MGSESGLRGRRRKKGQLQAKMKGTEADAPEVNLLSQVVPRLCNLHLVPAPPTKVSRMCHPNRRLLLIRVRKELCTRREGSIPGVLPLGNNLVDFAEVEETGVKEGVLQLSDERGGVALGGGVGEERQRHQLEAI